MGITKRVSGDYNIISIDKTVSDEDPGRVKVSINTNLVEIDGSLAITDDVIIINNNEDADHISSGYAGLEVDRGTSLPAKIQFNDTRNRWFVDRGDGVERDIITEGAGGSSTIPYDLAYYIAGNMLFPDAIAGSFLAIREITLSANLVGSLARAKVAPTGDTVYVINVDNGVTITQVGTITFLSGDRDGSFTFASEIILQIGTTLEVVNPAVLDATIKDVAITLIGCAESIPCAL